MKYIITALFVTSLSFGALAEGEQMSGGDENCCRSGMCNNGMPKCGPNDVRKNIPAKKDLASNFKAAKKTSRSSETKSE